MKPDSIKKIVFTLMMGFLCTVASAQEKSETENDTWYVWLHTTASIDGKETVIISKDVFTTYCCVNSPKFARVLKRSEKWMQKNIDPAYTGTPLQKVQDLELARQTLEKLKSMDGVQIVDFKETCK